MKTTFENVFVTVGTTKFDKLIKALTRQGTLQVLRKRGCLNLILQIGCGEFVPPERDSEPKVTWYRYKDDLSTDILSSDLVISHAGAGSCLEVLSGGKNLLVVINDDLMDNHQTELAQKLGELGFLNYTICSDLEEAIGSFDEEKLKRYCSGDDSVFATFIDSYMGFQD